ncbi:UDP-3-O-(3-hydroxymyristoyl)glucosamine N-acyltransferase [Paracoccus sp. S-4012]|uniref:UDP-3-O-(3-hydroxymyristoyl)glucosamine N-acyltransferase n=1 Tax=Paracoccus sp. S-4012 TaxID=2665648 RepID=UPI0012AF7F3F|nr:UDP-3-O-(3-hydroxymyristoyl)glucosamine N-acyltransferase [Paracoccus sp. S-4012]MRX50835.1 UDP-3-O-(3-hydroxymyristoyl)glucosamine N-acyltransferase [Paracoccus sp. S-4012]
MQTTIGDLAAALGARHWGDAGAVVRGAAEPAAAAADEIALALGSRYATALKPGAVALIAEGMDPEALGLRAAVFAPRPRLAMAGLTRVFDAGPAIAPGIHPTAVIDASAEIGPGAAIGPFVVIGAGVVLGERARIASHASIGTGARIGADAMILEGARVGARVTAGDRLILHPGAVIGADGFAFVTERESGVEQARGSLGRRGEAATEQPWLRIHSLGTVELGREVEVGANATIDRGTIRATRIGDGTKIDNLVQVGHNCEIGRDCLLAGQAGIAGSVRIGDRVVLGGKVGVSDNIFIGDDVVAGGGTTIYSNVPAGRVILGSPAVRMETEIAQRKALRRLPRLFQRVAALEGSAPQDPDDKEDQS